ncbi:MAG: replication initiator protein A [Gallionella sp.]
MAALLFEIKPHIFLISGMDKYPVIKIQSSSIKHFIALDICVMSFIKDSDLYPVPKEKTDGEMTAFLEKGEAFSHDIPYCAAYAIKTGDMTTRRLDYKGKFIEFCPSPTGLPTVRDFDILLYCQSWIGNAALEGRDDDIGPVFEIDVEEFFEFAGRGRGDNRERSFIAALERLADSTINTNTKPFEHCSSSFKYIQQYRLGRDASGRLKTVTLKMPHRIFFLIHNEIFDTYDRGFLELSPIRRLIYMFLKSFCVAGCSLTLPFEKIHQLTGATSPLRKFMPVIDDLANSQLVGYWVEVDRACEMITFTALPAKNNAFLRTRSASNPLI